MKKNIWIAALAVITGCCVVGGTFYHTRAFGKISLDSVSDMEPFTSISIDADIMGMGVAITEGDSLSLDYQYTAGLKPVYEVKNKTLYIKQKASHASYGIWGLHRNVNECSLTLTIPAGTALDGIDVRTAMGGVDVEGITASKCNIESNMGSVSIKKCSFDVSDFNLNMGEISVRDTDLGDAEINNDMGNIEADECTFGDLRINASMGNASVDAAQELDGYRMDLSADLGSVTVNGHHESGSYYQTGSGAGKLEIQTSMGSVHLKTP